MLMICLIEVNSDEESVLVMREMCLRPNGTLKMGGGGAIYSWTENLPKISLGFRIVFVGISTIHIESCSSLGSSE